MKTRNLLLLLAVAACSKSESGKPAPAPEKAAAPEAAAAPAPAPAATASADSLATIDKIDCAKVLPQSLVDRFFKGAKVTTTMDNICDISTGDDLDDLDFNIEYKCEIALSDQDATDAATLLKMTPVPGVGRVAFSNDIQLEAFDKDTACLLVASYLKPIPKMNDFMAAALDAVPAH